MTIPPHEIRSSLQGAFQILKRDPKALFYFNLTPTGFWHSFQAIWIALVPYMLSTLTQRHWLLSEHNLTTDTFPNILFFASQIVGVGLEWTLLPLILWFAADFLDIKKRYTSFVIARNWTSIVTAWIFFAPTLAYASGVVVVDVLVLAQIVLLGFVLFYGYRVARATLSKPAYFCIGLVAADFLTGLISSEMLWVLIEPSLIAAQSLEGASQ